MAARIWNGHRVEGAWPQAPSFSFEFYPPSTPELGTALWKCIEELAPLDPAFVSVTYGAGGSTRERTHATVRRILSDTGLQPAAHLTCVGATRDEVDEVVRDYAAVGVRHIVALRGDPPAGSGSFVPHPGGYGCAADLVAGIRKLGDFEISVAAYPEVHPDARSAEADLDNLKRKIDAGACRAITQFFFDPDVYLRFVDRARAAGIWVPIIPGILPVTNFARIQQFAARCGASIPALLAKVLGDYDCKPEVRMMIAATVAADICRELLRHGVREFHFYTLNRAELTRALCHILQARLAKAA